MYNPAGSIERGPMTRHGVLNLDDLVRATGFSKRQIRFYITKKLVPAAENRGPNAVYPQETLPRLLRIAELKRQRIGPARRRFSLEEIRHKLDSGPDPVAYSVPGGRIDDAVIELLTRLAAQLEEFVDHGRLPHGPDRPRNEAHSERWHRIAHLSLPDIEITIRQPQRDDGRERMEAAARTLRDLLETDADR